MPSVVNPLTPDYVWDDVALRYRDVASGRFVSAETVRTVVDHVVAGSAVEIERLALRVSTGAMPIAEWQSQMAQTLRLLHTGQAAAAAGGWANMTQADWGRVGAELRAQYRWLEGFAQDIETGRVSGGAILTRASMYADAARGTYEQTRRAIMRRNGAREERRVLGKADHCDCCIGEAGRGWQPIGTLIRIGGCTCIVNCKCSFEYRDAQGVAM